MGTAWKARGTRKGVGFEFSVLRYTGPMRIETFVALDSAELFALRGLIAEAIMSQGATIALTNLDAKLFEGQIRIDEAQSNSELSVVV